MKKIIVFSTIIIVLFVALSILTNKANEQQSAGNPFGKTTLHGETLKQLDDPNYQNIIVPLELDQRLENNETITVYFYSPICPACVQASPIVVPMTASMGIDLKLFNLLEFEEGWNKYRIDSTPVIVHYLEGIEVGRAEGLLSKNVYEDWFSKVKQTY